ncbi:MAG: prepilin-type N-terminal cleavage/methylation domain-containing protein [Patescibacteria group bacterium]|nr:prepilin-type N-terminal cleavage/methylation domain-containing protein [Patescibacteria group bacterium]
MKQNSKIKGFTLIELLVVISIIGLLASIVMVSLNSARLKARDARRKSDLAQLATAINLFLDDNGYLPRNQTGWCTYISNPANNWGPSFQADLQKYMSKVPLDPRYSNQSGDFFYSNDNNSKAKFTLCTVLEQPTGNNYDSTYGGCAGWTSAYNYCISQ